MIIAMDREALIEELDRLLDVGEPLLAVFPSRKKKGAGGWIGWILQLPDNISDDMRWYADSVALRARNRELYQTSRRRDSIDHLAEVVTYCESGLLGWRAIGVLK